MKTFMRSNLTYRSYRSHSILAMLLPLAMLSGCQTTTVKTQTIEPPTLQTAYDYQLLDKNWQPISLEKTTEFLKDADVMFIGEYHGNHASHFLETQLLAGLHKQHKNIILSMEMFNRDQQETLNDYIDGFIGEQTLIKLAPAWPNYKASYRPSVEYAKQHFLPIVAANASSDLVRCIGSQGEGYLAKLDETEIQWIAEQPFAEIEGYKEKFFGFMNRAKHKTDKANSERAQNTYLAQLTRDNTMAESILKAMKANPGYKVIHLNGSFHSENHLGTVGALKRLAPDLKIKVITPIYADELNVTKTDANRKDDFYYTLNPQPAEYVQNENRRKAQKAMFEESRKKAKACK